MTRKILVILAVLAVALAVATVSIEAQRGGGSRGGGSGGSGGMHPELNDNGNGNINGNFPPGNYDLIEVSVSTDKRRYVLDEPIAITVTAYNPTDSAIWVHHTDPCLEPLNYLIDGYIDRYTLVDENGTRLPNAICAGDGGAYLFQPYETLTRTFTRTGGYNIYGMAYYVPLPVGRHTVVGRIVLRTGGAYGTREAYESDPITIRVVDSDSGGMDGHTND